MKRWLVGVSALALLGIGALARAYPLDWLGAKLANGATYSDGGGDPFFYFVDETSSTPGGIQVEDLQADVQAAFAQWSSVPCSYIGARFAGAVTSAANVGTHSDTQSLIGSFVTSQTDPRYVELGNGAAVGVALTYTVDGVILGCDVEYNAVNWTYADDGTASAIDFPSVIQHETGHCFGLAHAPEDPNSVMYPSIADGEERRTLDARDVDNLCQLYPLTGAMGSPCSGNSCGGQLQCITDVVEGGDFCTHSCDVNITATGVDGGCEVGFGCKATTEISGATAACFPGAGDQAQVGGPCMFDTDCVGAAAVCITGVGSQVYPDGYCSESCGGNACPYGNTCVEIGIDDGGNPQSYCLNDCTAVTGGCRDDGYSCNPITADGTGFCYPSCETDSDCGGAACLCSGVCVTVGKPSSTIGAPCVENTDCPTGAFCIPGTLPDGTASGWTQGYCAESCGGTNACVVCPVGSSCVVDGQEGQAYCLQLCSANGGCRSTYACGSILTTSGDVEVCQPGDGSACLFNVDCPLGEVCLDGYCQEPGQDGGCQGALCPTGDGGVTVIGMNDDAGPSTMMQTLPLKPGCGCGSATPEPLLALLALVALRRRNRW